MVFVLVGRADGSGLSVPVLLFVALPPQWSLGGGAGSSINHQKSQQRASLADLLLGIPRALHLIIILLRQRPPSYLH
eukprot:m.452553 g.452553  ORF g.452553 m.452553 type:complete len:77 (+) comp20352_c0_seq1:414-644(+)